MLDSAAMPKKTQTKLSWGEGRMLFHAQRDEILRRIDAGEPATWIWRDLSPNMAYRTFVRHVALARKVSAERPSSPPPAPDPVRVEDKAAPGSLRTERSGYDPRKRSAAELFGTDDEEPT